MSFRALGAPLDYKSTYEELLESIPKPEQECLWYAMLAKTYGKKQKTKKTQANVESYDTHNF